MGIMKIGEKFYVSFKWNGNRIRTVTPARNETEAKKVERAVKTAFKINSFGHLNPTEQEVVVRTYENNGWVMPPELARPEPEEELTLVIAVTEFFKADAKHRAERNLYAIDRLVEHFGEELPLKDIKVPQIREYQRARKQKVDNGTINREMKRAVFGNIPRPDGEEALEFNPCMMVDRLPENQRDAYLSWEDFQRLLQHSWWLHDILVMLYYTGMRFGEVVGLRWEMYKPERRMLILPPEATKEGKSLKKARLRPKRIPLRQEVIELLESMRAGNGSNVVRGMGFVFTYCGRYHNSAGTFEGKGITRSMIRKAWDAALLRPT